MSSIGPKRDDEIILHPTARASKPVGERGSELNQKLVALARAIEERNLKDVKFLNKQIIREFKVYPLSGIGELETVLGLPQAAALMQMHRAVSGQFGMKRPASFEKLAETKSLINKILGPFFQLVSSVIDKLSKLFSHSGQTTQKALESRREYLTEILKRLEKDLPDHQALIDFKIKIDPLLKRIDTLKTADERKQLSKELAAYEAQCFLTSIEGIQKNTRKRLMEIAGKAPKALTDKITACMDRLEKEGRAAFKNKDPVAMRKALQHVDKAVAELTKSQASGRGRS